MKKCKRHRYRPTYWERCILNKNKDKYDYCLECGEERVELRKFKLVNYCGHCGTDHKNIQEATECCGGFQEQAYECRKCKMQFVKTKDEYAQMSALAKHECKEDDSDGKI